MVGALFLAALLMAAQASDSAYGRVTGQVIEQGSNSPIANARVNVFSMARQPANVFRTFETTTDADGKFVLENVPLGEYTVQASKAGYAMPTSGTRPPVIDVSAGQGSQNIAVMLVRGGAIAGRVVNAAGEPEAEGEVAALGGMPIGWASGPQVMMRRSAYTEDHCDYLMHAKEVL